MARCGVAVYGLDPFQGDPAERGLEPALSLRSYVADVKRFAAGDSAGYGQTWRAPADTWVGVLPLGYGDGVRRGLSNNAEVLIRGRRHPLVGTVSMDNVTVDLGPETEVEPGDEAVLIGAQGDESIRAEEVAGRLGTINYEVTCGISAQGAARAGMSVAAERLAAAPLVGLARGGAGGARRVSGSSAARSATRRWGGRWSTSTWRSPATRRRSPRRSRARAEAHSFELSAEFATWRVVAADRSWQIDVTALRGETIEADLGERDFTIGAVAVPLAGGEPIDPYGGLADLERGLLRAVGERSFAADPLRLLRAAALRRRPRAARSTRPPSPWRAPKRRRAGEPAGERQLVELRQLLGGPDPLRGLRAARRARPHRRRPARAGRAARGRTGAQPPPRRPRPHDRRARAHARGRGATWSASAASAPRSCGPCSPSRSPTR